ncbi:MAG TPA: DUF4124 domain-containing protein [Lysobacter sp.]
MSLALACGGAAAQQVFKCVDGDGAVSYQDAPCAAGSRQARAWQAAPEPPASAERQRELAEKQRRDREESAFLSHRAGTDGAASGHVARSPAGASPSACEQAKAQRQRKLDDVGLRRTFDLLSRLDEQVRKACR